MSIYSEMKKLGEYIGIPIYNTIAPDNIKDKNYLIWNASSSKCNYQDNRATMIENNVYLSYFTLKDLDLVEQKLMKIEDQEEFDNFIYDRAEMTLYIEPTKQFQTVYVLNIYCLK